MSYQLRKALEQYKQAKKYFQVKVASTEGIKVVTVSMMVEAERMGKPLAVQSPDGEWLSCSC